MKGLGHDSVVTAKFQCEVCRGLGNERLGGEKPSCERFGRESCEALVMKARS